MEKKLNYQNEITIENKIIGNNQPCYIIAEIGINHNGSIDVAKKLIDAAKESGVDDTNTNCVGSELLLVDSMSAPGPNRFFHFCSCILPTRPSRQFCNPSISTRPLVGLATARNKNAAFRDATARGRFPSKSVAQ